MSENWPEFKHVCGDFNGVSYREGWNSCREEFMKAIEEDSERITKRELFEEILNLKKDNRELESHLDSLRQSIEERRLDEKQVGAEIFNRIFHLSSISLPMDECQCIAQQAAEVVCSKFATLPAKKVSAQDILYVLYDRDSLGNKLYEKRPEEIAQAISDYLERKHDGR